MGAERDVFISYGHADADWVRTLAENLYQSGLELFFDEWDIAPGDVLVHMLDAGILASRSGILVVSPTALTRPYVQAEYAALMARAIERGQRLIPVLLQDAEMPPLLASRLWVDFRNADGPDYLARVRELVRALKGEHGPPPRTGELRLPPGTGFKAAGTLSCRLSITRARTALSGPDFDIAGPPPRAAFDFDDLEWKLRRARAHWGPLRDVGGAEAGRDELETTLHELGSKVADALLPAEVVAALAKVVAEAERLNGSLQLALDVADPFANLPWETLRLPQTGVLALHPRVELFRHIETGGAAPAVSIPGPLRILVAFGSPEAQNAYGELLDMEAELQTILDATDKARRAGKAFVRILEQGSVAAIHTALTERRYHVLHISCHAAPGALILEDANGREDAVTAQRFCDEAIPAERAPPLVVLAGCSTGQEAEAADGNDVGRLPGLARSLVARGVPAIIAMQAPVGDRYSTNLMGCVYEALAAWEEPRPLAALCYARRHIEDRRRADRSALQPPPEWATPAFFCSASPLRLFDATRPFEALKEASGLTFDPGVVVRRIGDMVGRRREQRRILNALRDADGAGVLIHGIGGVGKSTLAAQILHRLADADGFLLISLEGETDPDRILGAIGARLFSISLAQGEDEKAPLRQLAGVLREPKHPWRDRFEFLAQNLLTHVPVAFLFDNFENNLKDGAPAEDLAALLACWLKAPLKSRLVFTCRYPFDLPDDVHERLDPFHLGPLSWAETRKLFWRLDGLKALSPDDQRRAYESVGGHPRALEYLDAILRGGAARFPDVQSRLRKQLKAKGIGDPARWCADTAGGLDAALAETVTLAADDVLLDQLIVQLTDEPLARRLLIGASVYRVAVENEALAADLPIEIALARGGGVTYVSMGMAPEGFAAAKQRLMDLSLLALVRFADDEDEMFFVHRWTAGALAERVSEKEWRDAHRAAAAYWRRRADARPRSREGVADLLEARHHLHAVRDLAQLHEVSGFIITQLQTWGAWEWEERLIRETLAWMPEGSEEAGVLLHQLGHVYYLRGEYDAGQESYRKALAIREQLGDPGIASSYHQLGMVAQCRGDFDLALDWHRKALAIVEQRGDLAGMARCYHHLGLVTHHRGDYDAALDWYHKALAIDKQLGNDAGMASCYHQLGMVTHHRGDYDAALDWYHKALAIEEHFGDRNGMAATYGRLGLLARDRGDFDLALDWYHKALAIKEQLGDRNGMASSYHQLGLLARDRGDFDAALDWTREALAIDEQLGDRVGIASCYRQLGIIARDRGDFNLALEWYRKALTIFEQLGDRDGMATTLSQIGVFYTQTNRAADAVPLNLQSLALNQQMQQSPEIHIDLHWLSSQRRMLGEDAFRAIVAEHCGAERTASLFKLLNDFDQAEGQTGTPAPGSRASQPGFLSRVRKHFGL